MLNHVIEEYKERKIKEIRLDVLAKNPGAIKLYQNLGFEQMGEVFEGFNHPEQEKPDVFSMKNKL